MPSNNTNNQDNCSIFTSIQLLIKSQTNKLWSTTCDGLVLRMHYRWTFWLLLACVFTVSHSWYYKEIITCASHFNSETQVRLDHMNICLSYPYVEADDGSRRYIFFYRWISWSLLVLAGLFYIPRKISKTYDNPRCKKLLEDLVINAPDDDQVEEKVVEKVARYFTYNRKTLNGLYWKYVRVNIAALIVDLFAMQYLDFILEGRFLWYGFNSYPLERDPINFSDYMSQTFPPFVSCQLTSANQLISKRIERFGCHLTLMEFYDKMFLGLWVWLTILTVAICVYIIFLFCMWAPWIQSYLLRTAKPDHGKDKVQTIIQKVVANSKIGDIYLLHRFKGHMSDARFYELLVRLSEPSLPSPQVQPEPEPKPDTKINLQDSLRRRTTAQDPPNNTEHLQLYPSNLEMTPAGQPP